MPYVTQVTILIVFADDLSNQLIHLTKSGHADNFEIRGQEAFTNLKAILSMSALLGGTGFIKGSIPCVCFSEAPVHQIAHLLAQKNESGTGFKYSPYGVMVGKNWVYSKGGLPAIYGPDAQYDALPKEMRYRHIRYELNPTYSIDHSWEREWRIETKCLSISPESATVILPDRNAKQEIDALYAGTWYCLVLADLGVVIG